MTKQATGHFTLNWGEKPAYDDAEGATLARVTITKTWEGDLTGTSVTEMIKAMSGVENSAGYVAIERIVGTLHGRKGSFVVQHSALMDRGKGELSIRVVPDTGTGELTGIHGSLTVDPSAGHKWVMDYSLDAND